MNFISSNTYAICISDFDEDGVIPFQKVISQTWQGDNDPINLMYTGTANAKK